MSGGQSNDGSNGAGAQQPPPTPPSWRAHEFETAPTEEQLRKINAEEQTARELKAGSGQYRPSVTEAVKTIKAGDFIAVHKAPCSREGFLTGIGGGAAVGALRFIIGGGLFRSANWAVGSFVATATATYEYCQYRRRRERENMKRVVEIKERRNVEKRAEQQQARKAAAEEKAAREAAAAAAAEQRRSWYKFW